jgi:8-oxo-dGTP pyrophosphatase MutT (NUDIX family)
MSDKGKDLHETLTSRERLHQGRYIDLLRDEVTDARGRRHVRELVVHPGAVAMVPLRDDGKVLLVRQYRHGAGTTLLEIPAGTLDRADDGTREDPAVAAARELTEETGYRAANWRALGSFFTAPGFATEEMFLYLATGLEEVADYAGPAPDELLELVPVAWAEALAMAERGDIRDAKTLVGLWRVDALMRAGELAMAS